MKHPAPAALRLLPLLAVLLSVGCANPYLGGFTGDADPPLPEDAPVAVIGANRADPLAMAEFDDAYAHAKDHHTLLGTSTIVSGNALRDAVAAEAGRELGATLVLYSFAYITSTVETDTSTYYRHRDDDNNRHFHDVERTERTDRTRHWFEYRAYFFRAGR